MILVPIWSCHPYIEAGTTEIFAHDNLIIRNVSIIDFNHQECTLSIPMKLSTRLRWIKVGEYDNWIDNLKFRKYATKKGR